MQDVVFGNEILARGLHLKSACLSVNTFAWYLKNILKNQLNLFSTLIIINVSRTANQHICLNISYNIPPIHACVCLKVYYHVFLLVAWAFFLYLTKLLTHSGPDFENGDVTSCLSNALRGWHRPCFCSYFGGSNAKHVSISKTILMGKVTRGN